MKKSKEKPKSQGQIWDETPIVFGVYMNKKTGALALARQHNEKPHMWMIDEGKRKAHPLFRASWSIVAEGTGQYFFNRTLKNYVLIDEGTFEDEKDEPKPSDHACVSSGPVSFKPEPCTVDEKPEEGSSEGSVCESDRSNEEHNLEHRERPTSECAESQQDSQWTRPEMEGH